MPAEIVSHLVRRGVQAGVHCMKKMQMHHSASPISAQEAMDKFLDRIRSPEAIITFATTAVIFVLLTSAIEYAIRIVAVNLAAVEDTDLNGSIKLPIGPIDDMAKGPLLDDYDGEIEERAVRPVKPITSSIRSTFRHLSTIGGIRSRWRGLTMGIFYSIVFAFFNVIFAAFLSFIPILGFVIARISAAALTCNARAAWTHATIAMPSEKPFFQRFLPRKTARHLVLPTIRLEVGLLALQGGTSAAAALTGHIINGNGITWLTANAFFLPIAVFLAITFLYIIPAQIALIRAEASLLPEDRAAVVPFDRTFGGRIAWEGFACRKAYVFKNISIRGAYMAFDKATYKRVVKMFVKLFLIMTTISVLFFTILAAEFYALAGKEAEQVLAHGVSWNF